MAAPRWLAWSLVLLLAMDTSTPQVTVALAELAADSAQLPTSSGTSPADSGDQEACRVLAERAVVAANRHGELLAPLIEDVFRHSGATRSDLAAVAVGLGPGPFTGLRVGIVTAAAMGDALGIPMYGAGSLDVLACAHRGDGDYLVVTDARRKQVYWARCLGTGTRTDGPELEPPHLLADRFRGRVKRVAGAGALLHREAFEGFEVDERSPYPLARDLARLVAGRACRQEPADPPDPLYLRRPDARPPGAPKAVTPA
jgi:tRNA threonylcarbamoyl adenosine modification protein YeaZ